MDENGRNDIPPSGGVQNEQLVAAVLDMKREIKEMKQAISHHSGEMSTSQDRERALRREKKEKDNALIETYLANVVVPDVRRSSSYSTEDAIEYLEVGVGLVCLHRQVRYRDVLALFARGVPVRGHSVRIRVGCGEDHLDALLLQHSDLAEYCRAIVCVGEAKVLPDGSLQVPCTDSQRTFSYSPDIVLPPEMWYMGIAKKSSRMSDSSVPLQVINSPYEVTYVPASAGVEPITVVPPNENTAVACNGDTKKEVIKKT